MRSSQSEISSRASPTRYRASERTSRENSSRQGMIADRVASGVLIVRILSRPASGALSGAPLARSIVPRPQAAGDVAEHGAAGGVLGRQAARLDVAGVVQVDLVLEDLLDHDGHLVGG